jgi:hypothetical protein
MADRSVTLNYDGGKFRPVPNTVIVSGQDTIVFQVGLGGAPDRKLKITIKDHEHFPAEGLERTGTQPLRVQVGDGFKNKTNYKCQLFDGQGTLLASGEGTDGGDIEPDTGGGPH